MFASSSLVDLFHCHDMLYDMPWLIFPRRYFGVQISLQSCSCCYFRRQIEEDHVFWMGTYWNHIVPYFCHRSYNQSAWQCSDGNCIKGDVCKHGMVWGCRLAVLPCLQEFWRFAKCMTFRFEVFFRQQISLVAFQGSLHTLRCKVQWKTDSWRDDRMILVASPLGSKIRCFGNHNMVIKHR